MSEKQYDPREQMEEGSGLEEGEGLLGMGASPTEAAIGRLQPVQPLQPDRFRYDWWRCLRKGPVSGRYEGEMTSPNAGRYALDLRVDIDPRYRNSPILDRVSADIYQIYTFSWPGGRRFSWRIFRESWIVDRPTVRWSRCSVTITGRVRFWKGSHPATNVTIVIPWGTFTAAGPAEVTLSQLSGGTAEKFSCARKSDCFRDVTLEIDVAQSVNQAPITPDYNTHWHTNRPVSIEQRTLTIEEAYREAGICMTTNPQQTIINDSATQFNSWSVAELHDAMETHFSQIGGGWPKWRMWGLLAGRFDNSGVGGIMFDAAAQYGGSGEPPERQGFAVFRNHSWFNNLPSGTPNNQAEAAAIRKFLYTWVHEAGHAFNFLHSWNKNRPDALSWMNYDWKYDNRNGSDSFWANFEMRFDTEELLHIRHGDRTSVIMGGDPWASGGHLEAPLGNEVGMVEGDAPLELLVRSKGYFEFMEPVFLELRLRNLIPDLPLDIDTRLDPSFGTVAIYIMRPNGEIVHYDPVFCQLGDPEIRSLKPANSTKGEERYSQELPIDFGKFGHYFTEPGSYRVRAVYQGLGDTLISSNVHTIRVGLPGSKQEERLAQDYFSYQAGMALCLGGSQSPFLRTGMKSIEEVIEQCQSSAVGGRIASIVAEGKARPFFRLDEKRHLKMSNKADTNGALRLMDVALKIFKPEVRQNIAYHNLVRRRAALLTDQDKKTQAKKEIDALLNDLKKRGVNQPVLNDIAAFEEKL
jgi:hypothetical protein